MLVRITPRGDGTLAVVVAAEEGGTSAVAADATGPNPIAPESKELLWGAGSFLVLLVIMRLVLFPRLKRGMDARYEGIRSDLESADATRAAARSDVAAYEAALAEVRAEAAARIDAARQTLDAERQVKVAEANGRIATKRAAADAEIAAARAAVRDQVASAVATVTEKTVHLAVGTKPDQAVVRDAVARVMQSGAN
jgi:F-type H+-transporting ATPase subunit b